MVANGVRWALVLALCGCAHVDYNGAARLTAGTAYTLDTHETLIGLGLVGTHFDNLGATLRVEHGLFPNFELGTNLLHNVAPLVNVYGKGTVLDTRYFGLGVRLGFKWLNPDHVWALPDTAAIKANTDADLFMVPVSVALSFPLASFYGLHATFSYLWITIDGAFRSGGSYFDGGAMAHEVTVDLMQAFYLGAGVALVMGVEVPVYSAVAGDGYAERTMAPGVVSGVRASLTETFDVTSLVTGFAAVHIAWEHFNLRLTATWGLRFLEWYYRLPYGIPLPGFEFHWRF